MGKAENFNELVVIEKETALQVFQKDKGLDPYLEKIRAEIDGFVPDISTKKGRDQVASIAHRVARSKTYLDGVGKELVAELKEIPKKIDAERKRMRDTLDQWRDEVRAPLNEWEAAEEERVNRHKGVVEMIVLSRGDHYDEIMSSAKYQSILDMVEEIVIDDALEEFEAEAHREKQKTVDFLKSKIEEKLKYEAEQAELERLRAEVAAREQKEREERIAQEAEERARKEAEEKAKAEREAAIKREQEAKAEAERREMQITLEKERAEREKLEAIQRAERAEKEAAEKAEREHAEKLRKEKEEAERREANRKHAAKIHNQAVAGLMKAEIVSDNVAKAIITLIAKGEVPNVKITY